jgi:hypothetical protein
MSMRKVNPPGGSDSGLSPIRSSPDRRAPQVCWGQAIHGRAESIFVVCLRSLGCERDVAPAIAFGTVISTV